MVVDRGELIVRYEGEASIDADTLVEALSGLQAMLREAHAVANNDGSRLDLKINAIKPSSIIIVAQTSMAFLESMVSLLNSSGVSAFLNIVGLLGVGAATTKGAVGAIGVYKRLVEGPVVAIEETDASNDRGQTFIKVTHELPDGTRTTVETTRQSYELANRPAFQNALQRAARPVGTTATSLAIEVGGQTFTVVESETYDAFVAGPRGKRADDLVTFGEVWAQARNPEIPRPDAPMPTTLKWRIRIDARDERAVELADTDFIAKLYGGHPISAHDIYRMQIETTSQVDRNGSMRVVKRRVIKVIEIRRSPTQQHLFEQN